ncbi:hypothetical protein K458DRAFT_295832 [Lentithecium fluviatile CBS 122367]|uniref:Uncharacterized protein n=1 Tax=Lentithecium fluviatile CBS 122367 TaxID=1168545 RepID=A0A6G1JB98_9PLEO|nr:hypothetical protein K458DRAFT_295832 [Lentithecium fluviatile CBS 122367]
MHISIVLFTIYITTSLAAALPASATYAAPPSAPALPTAKAPEFFLVTSDQSEPSLNTSVLRGVSATTPFQDDPLTSYLVLRLLASGYNTLPAFNFTTAHTLSTLLSTGRGTYTYDTAPVVSGQQLQFLRQNRTAGNIGLKDGYLVSVDGQTVGWTVCKTTRGSELLYWKGVGANCRATFLQAVRGAPYRKR